MLSRQPAASQFHKEAYICDTTNLKHRLQRLTCSMSDCSVATEESTAWFRGEEQGTCSPVADLHTVSEADLELWVDESVELLVDDPDEVSWLAELFHRAPIDRPQLFSLPQWAGE